MTSIHDVDLYAAKVELLQHTSQLNLLLVAVPRMDDLSKPRRKIGFATKEADR